MRNIKNYVVAAFALFYWTDVIFLITMKLAEKPRKKLTVILII